MTSLLRVRQEIERIKLRTWLEDGIVEFVEVIPTSDACEACKDVAGTKYTIEDALEQMPLPVSGCSNQANGNGGGRWCRCSYVPLRD